MDKKNLFLIFASLCVLILFTGMRWDTGRLSNETVLVGCTPGDPLIKSALNIFYRTNVDFIRWNLTLRDSPSGINTFVLNISYGESKPNTPVFKDGGEKLFLEGVYSISEINDGKITGIIYQLKCYNSKINIISFIKLNENLFHLLTPGNQLMVGNSGWSYTLSRKTPVDSDVLPSLSMPSVLLQDTVTQITYEGRTPCAGFPSGNVSPGCFKIKWMLTLHRDHINLQPTTYTLLRISDTRDETQGVWTMTKGSPSNPDAVIYKLDPDKPEKSISLFVADKNVIFFLDKASQLITGNGDFSYTLNKKFIGPRGIPDRELLINEY